MELTCNVSDNQATSVYWMKDMEIRGHGKTLITEVQELPDAGNYTCQSTDTHEVLSYSFLLITKKDSNGEMIKSILKSFKGKGIWQWDVISVFIVCCCRVLHCKVRELTGR